MTCCRGMERVLISVIIAPQLDGGEMGVSGIDGWVSKTSNASFSVFYNPLITRCHSPFPSPYDPTHPNNSISYPFSRFLTIYSNYSTMEPRNSLYLFFLIHSQDDCHGRRNEGCAHSSRMAWCVRSRTHQAERVQKRELLPHEQVPGIAPWVWEVPVRGVCILNWSES